LVVHLVQYQPGISEVLAVQARIPPAGEADQLGRTAASQRRGHIGVVPRLGAGGQRAHLPAHGVFQIQDRAGPVRQAIAGLLPGDAPAITGAVPGPGGAGPGAGWPGTAAGRPAAAARALQMIAWAVAEHGPWGRFSRSPPAWRTCRRMSPAAGTAWASFPPGADRDGAARRRPAQLACHLLGELEERRQVILTARSCAPDRRTYDSLAAEFGVGRQRVRQLETSALQRLARTAAHDRYRPLRWRAAPAARPGGAGAAAIPGAPPWLGPDAVLAGRPARLTAVYPLPARPASSVLSVRARAFKAWLEPVTPPSRNARRDTGLPAAASRRATVRA